jgi:hypothetical protein
LKGFVKYAVEMGSSVMDLSIFMKIGTDIQNLIRGIHRHTAIHTAWRSYKPALGKYIT